MKLSLFILIFFTGYMIYLYNKNYEKNKFKKNNFSYINSKFYKRYNEKEIEEKARKKNYKKENKEENKNYKYEKTKENNFNDYCVKKGQTYEYRIKCYFENLGYNVYPNGYINGKKDEGIDLIAYKNNEVHLIQCKHYKNPPKQEIIRMFIGDCEVYIKNNKNKLNNKTIYKDFITSCKNKDYGVIKYLEKNKDIINYLIIE